MFIREATSRDRDDIQAIYLSAFPAGEGEMVSRLAVDLLSGHTTPETISLVAEVDRVVVGNVAFSPVTFENNGGCHGYILSPLAVMPDYQKQRTGSELVRHGLQILTDRGANIVFVYGDPGYYGRFGFGAEAARRYRAPYRLRYPFGWQAAVLRDFDAGGSPVSIHCVKVLGNPELW